MERRAPEPKTDIDRILTPEEVRQFQDHILWPVVDTIFGENFRENAAPGEDVAYRRTIVNPVTSKQLRVNVEAECYPNWEDDVPGGKGFALRVRLEERRDDLLEGIMRAAGLGDEYEELQHDPDFDPYGEGFVPWYVKSFEFDSAVDVKEFHSLEDADQEEIWNDYDYTAPNQTAANLSSEDLTCLQQLNAQLTHSMTENDRLQIGKALLIIGFDERRKVV